MDNLLLRGKQFEIINSQVYKSKLAALFVCIDSTEIAGIE